MTVTLNPLVASRLEGPPDAYAGVWAAEDLELLTQGIAGHDWVDAGLGGLGAGLDALGFGADPLGTLAQYGVAWLIEHVRPLTEALDALAGDPGEVAAQARTWHAVSGALAAGSAGLDRAARWDVPAWTGPAAGAYRQRAGRDTARARALGAGAGLLSAATEGAGLVVASVRALVRDAIAACVARLITYALEELSTFGLGTPLVIAQVSVLVAKWAARIAEWLRALLRSLARLSARVSSAADQLARLAERAADQLSSAAGRAAAGAGRRRNADPVTGADEVALQHYTGFGYRALNRCLRSPDGCSGVMATRAGEVSAALAKLDPQPGITFRGTTLSGAELDLYQPGTVVREAAFTSSSRTMSVAGQYFGGNTLLVVHGRTGRNVAPYSAYPHEHEVLYDKGTRFRVLDRVRDDGADAWIITLEEDLT